MNSTDCSITPNPDIIGIGIRLSIYIPSLAGPVVGLFTSSEALLNSIEASLGVTGLALLFTSLISTTQKSLDLFHSLCLFHLVGLAGISIRPSGGEKKRKKSVVVLFYLGYVVYLSFMIYVIATAKTFGATPDCNSSVTFVLFGISVPATASIFRWIFLLALGSGLIGLGFRYLMAHYLDPEHKLIDLTGEFVLAGVNPFQLVGNMLGRIYVIAMVELMIKRNDLAPGIGAWSFGQVLAMMMLFAPVMECVSVLRDEGKERSMLELYESVLTQALGWQMMGNFLTFAVIAIMDLGWNALAGVATARTGAHVNGSPITGDVVRIGAIAGVIKSGVLNFSLLLSKANQDIIGSTTIFGLSSFGISFIVTVAIAQKVLHEATEALMIASLATGAALMPSNIIQELNATQMEPVLFPIRIAFDAISGYTFARVAQNHGYELCQPKAAAAAGAVYGVILGVVKLVFNTCIVQGMNPQKKKKGPRRRAGDAEALQLLQR